MLQPAVARRLQRLIGNRAVAKLLAGAGGGSGSVVQRGQGDPAKGVAEAQYAKVAKGQTIKFTKLAAGCMAVTATFSDGGGVGYHFAMMEDNAAQWSEFIGQIGSAGLASVQVDSDMVGEKQGWWVQFEIDEDFAPTDPKTGQGPRSYASLTEELEGDSAIFSAGWVFDQSSIAKWFKAAFGVDASFAVTQSPGPYTL
ncbi:MAG: hypothetical protein O3B31_03825 [Chloroflexi bacterium]|nr:hypothetical protein [Chloroflexota bacterium]MQC27519.1 hypothetical protein [Chloroflexota bacterium]